jgi:hypothetical protein
MPKRIIKVSILDAAKRQMETAVRLYFNDADPVSVYTLTGASHAVLTDLIKKNGSKSSVSDFSIRNEYKREVRSKIRKAKNHLHSAAKNPESTVTVNVLTNEYFLFDACEKYMALTSEHVPYFIIFRGWFVYKHPNMFSFPRGKHVMIDNLMKTYHGDKAEYFSAMLSAAGQLK